mgnify:CR=1 FL=1
MQSTEITNAFAQKFKEKASPQNALYVGPRSEKDEYTCIFSNFRNITENHHFIDLDNQKIIRKEGDSIDFEVDEFKKYCLLNGLDDIGLTLKNSKKIAEFEKKYSEKFSWA